MTRIIITPEQLKVINEAAQRIMAQSAGGSDILNAVTNANVDQNMPVNVAVPGNPDGKDYSTTMDALRAGDNIPRTAKNVYIEPGANGNVTESRYSKRQVELGRMLEMRRTGMVFSKKQLNEMFMEAGNDSMDIEEIKEKIGNCNPFMVFKAANSLCEGGEERLKETYMNGGDLKMALEEMLSWASENNEEGLGEFCESLGI